VERLTSVCLVVVLIASTTNLCMDLYSKKALTATLLS
jgi:hypothetical protein